MDFQAMVDEYVAFGRPVANEELDYYRQQPSLKAAVREAGLAHNSQGKKDFHQWRVQQITLGSAVRHLLENIHKIAKAATFDELHTIIIGALSTVKGAGELYHYDTALRIGAKMGLLPGKVYLHRGTREGARALNLDAKAVALDLSVFPQEFQALHPYEIEDLLCAERHKLRGEISRNKSRPGCPAKVPTRRACKRFLPQRCGRYRQSTEVLRPAASRMTP